jgi:hypothetical protein
MDLPSRFRNLTPVVSSREQSVGQRLRGSLQALLFWSGVVLPVFYLPLILTGPDTTRKTVVLLGLLGLHVLSLVSSHSYNPG